MSKTNDLDVFRAADYEELKHIYKEILKGREEELRPRCLDPAIEEVRKVYNMSIGEAWRYAEGLFWEEVGRRYFQ